MAKWLLYLEQVKAFCLIVALASAAMARAEFCNWGFAGPKIHRCNGENYFEGTAACDSGLFRDVFCHARFNQDGRACSDDNSQETLNCYNKLVAPRQTDPAPKNSEWCNWGFVGPQVITCDGQKYVYGSAACPSGMYSNIFCRDELSASGKACSEDNASTTVQCYHQFMQARPADRGRGLHDSDPARSVQ